MATDLTVILANKPGTIADLGEALGGAGINIEGMCGFPCEGEGIMHVLIDDADTDAALNALDAVGLEVRRVREVVLAGRQGEDRPGAMGEAMRQLANAGINVDLMYLANGERAVLGVDDIDAYYALMDSL